MIVFCSCTKHNPKCYICRNGRAAYRAGRRAYKQGRSSRAKHGWQHGYGHRWSEGWTDAREANPNTAAQRAKEVARWKAQKLRQLKRERAALDRRIKELTS